MKTQAAVVWPGARTFSIEEITLDPPGPGEVLVRLNAAGLCHSDRHLLDGGYGNARRPVVPGHEGAGTVEAVGPGVGRLRPGDRVVLAVPFPPCGGCPACFDGLPHLCERGALIGDGFQISDGTARHHSQGQDLSVFVFLGTFAGHTVVHADSCVPVDGSIAASSACTVACAGVTGWGSVLHTAQARPGDVVVIAGVGGIGANAVLAARFVGAKAVVAIEPVAWKREAAVRLGATVAVETFDDAHAAVRDLTSGRMANAVVMAMSVGDGRYLDPALDLVGKRGRVVVVNVHPAEETSVSLSLRTLQSLEKQVVGCLAGSWDGRRGIAFLTELQRRGLYDPAAIVTRVYEGLDELERGYRDQADGEVLRGVVQMSPW